LYYYTLPLCFLLFLCNDPATPEIYTLSLHDALPILLMSERDAVFALRELGAPEALMEGARVRKPVGCPACRNNGYRGRAAIFERSEEHTSELQSPYDLVCRLLLEKKKRTRRGSTKRK